MSTVATLTLDIVGRSDKLRAELAKSRKQTKSWAAQTRSGVNSSAKAFGSMGTVAGIALAVIYAKSAKALDAVAKLSDAIGEAPEKVMALGYAAEITGVGTEKMNKALVKQAKSIGEAASGTGEAKKYLDQLGLSTQKFYSLSPAEQFAAISDKVNGLSTQHEKAAAASAIFGREGTKLLNTMALGSKGLAEMATEADALGITMTRIDLAKIEAANDAFHRAKSASSAFGKVLAAETAPLVTALSNQFLNAAKEAGGFGNLAQDVIATTIDVVAKAADVVNGFSVAWQAVKQAVYEVASGYVQLINVIAQSSMAEVLGMDPSTAAEVKKFSSQFQREVEGMRSSLHESAMAPPPSIAIKKFVAQAQAEAETAAQAVAKSSAANIGAQYTGGDTSAATEKVTKENNKIVSLHQEKFNRIWQANLEAHGKHDALEAMRFEKQQTELEAERLRLTERGLMTAELQSQFFVMEEMAAQTHAEKLKAIDKEAQAVKLENLRRGLEGGGQLFGSMAELTAAFGKKQSGTYKAMFAASKAFAIAEAGVKIQQGLANAWALGFPAGIPAAATVISSTAGIIGTMKGTDYAGGYEQGGIIGGNSTKGDKLWANVNSKEMVLNQGQQAQLFSMANGGGQSKAGATNNKVTVNVIEDASRAGKVDSIDEDRVIQIYVSNVMQGGDADQVNRQRYGSEVAGWK